VPPPENPVPAARRLPRRWERLGRGLSGVAALAACLLLFALAPEISIALRADYVGDTKGITTIDLPDSSRVTLNRDSAIRLHFGNGLRQVELLRGEAFFEVRPDPQRPFQVLAEGGVSEAVGTTYAVRRGEAGVTVAVSEGRVAVTAGGGPAPAIALRAGEGLRYAADGRLGGKFPLDVERELAWRRGKVVFVDRPLAEALAELERYHPGEILLLGDEHGFQPISGVVDLDRLDQGIAALAATHGLSAFRLTPYLTVLR
jgi:transmembrane sensor